MLTCRACSQGKLRGVILLHIRLHLTNLDSTRALGMAQVANLSTTGQLIRQTKMLFHHEDNLKRLSDPTEVAKLDPSMRCYTGPHRVLSYCTHRASASLLLGGYRLSSIVSV